jgi:hypothetical protein
MPVTTQELIRRRLENQQLRSGSFDPVEVVAWFGAVQAQDYLGGLWAVGQRSSGALESDVELAIAERKIVRTWPMRGTLHFVAADDARWMLELLAPRVIQRHAARLTREFELDKAMLTRCRKVLVHALEGGRALTRPQVYHALEAQGISGAGQRGIHILGRLAMEGLLCFGPREGKQHTFVLLDEWVPEGRGLLREEALAELALRYVASHGPVTVSDFAWWSGLPVADARAGLTLVERRLVTDMRDGESYWFLETDVTPRRSGSGAHLLPPFDEYLVGYKSRDAVLEPRHAHGIHALLSPVVEIGGRIVGTWGRRLDKGKVMVECRPFGRLASGQRRAIALAAKRYGRYLGLPAECRM